MTLAETPDAVKMSPTDAEWAWAAGLFEGEGCVTFTRSPAGRKHPKLTLRMTDEDVVRRFQAATGGRGRVHGPTQPSNLAHKPNWQWVVASKSDVALVVTMFRPWLGDRRRSRVRELLGWEL